MIIILITEVLIIIPLDPPVSTHVIVGLLLTLKDGEYFEYIFNYHIFCIVLGR